MVDWTHLLLCFLAAAVLLLQKIVLEMHGMYHNTFDIISKCLYFTKMPMHRSGMTDFPQTESTEKSSWEAIVKHSAIVGPLRSFFCQINGY